MRNSGFSNLKRLLVMRLDNIGDVILAGPALRALRAAFPEAELSLMTSPAGSAAVPLLPWVDRALSHRVLWQDAFNTLPFDPGRELEFISELSSYNFDAVFVLTSFSQTPHPAAYLCYLAGIPIRVGQSKEFGGSVLSHRVKSAPDSLHQALRNLHLLQSVGIVSSPSSRLELHVPRGAAERGEALLKQLGISGAKSFVVIAPGASCQARRYPVQKYMQAAKLIKTGTELPIVILGSERERDILEAAQQICGAGIYSLVGRTSLAESAAVIRSAALVVANDSAAMHIADAFSVPQLLLFSGTDLIEQWAPQSSPYQLLQKNTACAPCYRFNCPYQLDCLDFTAEEVALEALTILESLKLSPDFTLPQERPETMKPCVN